MSSSFSRSLTKIGGWRRTRRLSTSCSKSRALVQRTVAALQLWKRPEFGAPTEAAAVDAVQGKLQVFPLRGTRLVHLRFRWPEPKLATEIINAHARQYIEQSLEKRFVASKDATDWLDTQLAEERKRVEASDSALQSFRERHDAVSLDEGQNIVVQKLADLNSAVTKAKTERITKETEYRELLRAQRSPDALDGFPAILSNSFIQQLKGTIATLQREYAELSATLGELHPMMVEKRTALETAEKRLAAEIARVVDSASNAYRTALNEEQTLTGALDEQKREALALNRRGIEYAALEREAESVRLVYQTLLQRAKETSVSRELRSTNLQIVDPARTPERPVWPRTTFNMLMSLITGTLLAMGSVFFLEMFDERLKAPPDVVRELGHTILGLVPEVKSPDAVRVSLAKREAPRELMETFRALRTSVMSLMLGEGRRSILIASAAQREGKTHVAANLAIALAQAQHRVLLIDADMRRPAVHDQITGHRLEPGLSNVLTGSAPLNEALQSASVPGLTVLAAGTPSSEAPELLGSPVFEKLLDVLHEDFDWVIIDSPPVLTVTDASIIAPHTTGIVFVVASAVTRGRTARLAIEQLQRVGGRLLGVVLNRADIAHHPFYFEPYSSTDYFDSLETTSVDRARSLSSSLFGKRV